MRSIARIPRYVWDLLVIGLTVASFVGLFIAFDVHDWWYRISRDYEDWQIDELLGLVLGGLVGLTWFALRRLTESRNELKRRVALEEHVRKSETKFRNLTDGSVQGVFIHRDLTPLYVNQACAEIFGYESVEALMAVGTIAAFIADDELPRLQSYMDRRQRGEPVPERYEFRGRRQDGSEIWLLNTVRLIEWDDGSAVQATIFDITARKAAQEDLAKAKGDLERRVNQLEELQDRLEEQARRAFDMSEELADARAQLADAVESISEGFSLWDVDDRLLMCNDRYRYMYPNLFDLLVPGTPFEVFLRAGYERGVFEMPEGDLDDAIQQRVMRHRTSVSAYEHELMDGRWVRVSKRRSKSGRIVSILTDISERKETEATIERMAHQDALTTLPNRTLFHKRLDEAIDQAQRTERLVGVMLLDLDHFKLVNDSMGHPAGDELLRQVADRLLDCVRKTDTVARLGGDEFAIVLTNTETLHGISRVAQRIVESLAQPFRIEGHEVHTGTSVGITIYPQDHGNADQLLRNADLALYRAKEAGRGTCQVFNDQMNRDVQARRMMEADLRRALEGDEFHLVYQPQFDIRSGEIIGAEALMRWTHPERGNIPPGVFIPVAEATRLIIPIEDWVMETACAQNMAWQQAGVAPITVSVNISPLHFRQENFVDQVNLALAHAGLSPEHLEIEVTEGLAMDKNIDAPGILARLKTLGCGLAIDDFGTGFSSLNRLHRFPVDRLKIDQSFVSDITEGQESSAISAAVIRLGHSLNIHVIAEGVETEEQLGFLVGQDCDQAQGYLLGRPMTADAFAAFMAQHDPATVRALVRTHRMADPVADDGSADATRPDGEPEEQVA